jgi:hypothetical protein
LNNAIVVDFRFRPWSKHTGPGTFRARFVTIIG